MKTLASRVWIEISNRWKAQSLISKESFPQLNPCWRTLGVHQNGGSIRRRSKWTTTHAFLTTTRKKITKKQTVSGMMSSFIHSSSRRSGITRNPRVPAKPCRRPRSCMTSRSRISRAKKRSRSHRTSEGSAKPWKKSVTHCHWKSSLTFTGISGRRLMKGICSTGIRRGLCWVRLSYTHAGQRDSSNGDARISFYLLTLAIWLKCRAFFHQAFSRFSY